MNAKRAMELLRDAEAALDHAACQFMMCRGEGYPIHQDMRTCHRCWTLRQIRLFLKREEAGVTAQGE